MLCVLDTASIIQSLMDMPIVLFKVLYLIPVRIVPLTLKMMQLKQILLRFLIPIFNETFFNCSHNFYSITNFNYPFF